MLLLFTMYVYAMMLSWDNIERQRDKKCRNSRRWLAVFPMHVSECDFDNAVAVAFNWNNIISVSVKIGHAECHDGTSPVRLLVCPQCPPAWSFNPIFASCCCA